jgi:hypothetical protein
MSAESIPYYSCELTSLPALSLQTSR